MNEEKFFLVINADDFGLSDGICRAVLELFEIKAISNTTIMVAADGAIPRLRKWNVSELLNLAGVHLQLTSEGKPISPFNDIPSLVNKATGNFLPKENLVNANLSEVELEWSRQVELGYELLGGPPTHLDSHHGVHRLPNLMDVYLSVATKFGLAVRGGLRSDTEFEKKRKLARILGTSCLIRDWTGRFLDTDILLAKLSEAKAQCQRGDVIELVTHPGYCDDYLISISGLNTAREHDLHVLKKIANKDFRGLNNIVLVKYPSLQPI